MSTEDESTDLGVAGDSPPGLTEDALRLRGAPKPLPQGPDETGAVVVRWDVAEPQLKFEAEFAAFCLMWWSHDFPTTKADAKRKAMEATLAFHGIAAQAAPTAGIFDILNKEGIDE